MALPQVLKRQVIGLARLAFRLSLALSSTQSFLNLIKEELKGPRLRKRMIDGGTEQLVETLTVLAHDEDLRPAHLQECYSQEGEDLFLYRYFAGRPSGFYVDVGALHPVRFSNTYRLYRQGWHGINIDATPGSSIPFNRQRPRDINVECVIADNTAPCTYFQFAEPALNTLSPDMARQREAEGFAIQRRSALTSQPLSAILDAHVPPGTVIDLLSIDVEGLDLAVLKSNDWRRYAPEVVIVELLEIRLDRIGETDIVRFLGGHGYRLAAKLFNSAIFIREQMQNGQA